MKSLVWLEKNTQECCFRADFKWKCVVFENLKFFLFLSLSFLIQFKRTKNIELCLFFLLVNALDPQSLTFFCDMKSLFFCCFLQIKKFFLELIYINICFGGQKHIRFEDFFIIIRQKWPPQTFLGTKKFNSHTSWGFILLREDKNQTGLQYLEISPSFLGETFL